MKKNEQPYQDVRSLIRGLRILEMLGQQGWTKPGELAALASIDRSSTYRLLNTLTTAGYVVKRTSDGSYALTSKIGLVADGYTHSELASQVVAPHLRQLTEQILWPSDFATLIGGEVVIVESTHRISPVTTLRAMIGKTRSVIRSALGQAILSALHDDELDDVLSMVKQFGGVDAGLSRNRLVVDKIIQDVKKRGYAAAVGAGDPKMGAIALPVSVPNFAIGAVNIIFFRSALTVSKAAERYLPLLRVCVEKIMEDLSDAAQRERLSNTTAATRLGQQDAPKNKERNSR